LIGLGHCKIACVVERLDVFAINERLQGYLKALQDNNIEVDSTRIASLDVVNSDGYDVGLQLLSQTRDFTAVFAYCDRIAYGLMKALKEEDISIPEDVSVISFDNIMVSNYVSPQLTTVAYPMRDIGTRGMVKLVKMISGKPFQKHETIPNEGLIVRESCSVCKESRIGGR
jgi:DNA-binding LacI/PurR family transcriptional regulator